MESAIRPRLNRGPGVMEAGRFNELGGSRSAMPVFIGDLCGGDCEPASIRSQTLDAQLRNLDPDMESLLEPFVAQSAPVKSIVALGCHHILGISRNDFPAPAIVAPEGGEQVHSLVGLARQARETFANVPGIDLLLLPAQVLNEIMTPLAEEFSFRAVAVLLPRTYGQAGGGDYWRLRPSLIERHNWRAKKEPCNSQRGRNRCR